MARAQDSLLLCFPPLIFLLLSLIHTHLQVPAEVISVRSSLFLPVVRFPPSIDHMMSLSILRMLSSESSSIHRD